MNPTTVREMQDLLGKIAAQYGGDTVLEFQDIDWEENTVKIFVENIVNYTDPSESSKKLIIRTV